MFVPSPFLISRDPHPDQLVAYRIRRQRNINTSLDMLPRIEQVMPMTTRKNTDPFVTEIERNLMPGQFISYRDMFEFMPGFEKVVAGASLEPPSFAKKAMDRWKAQTT